MSIFSFVHKLSKCKGIVTKLAFTLKMPYYAVAKGRKIGIFNSWPECESQVKGYGGAKFKKFPTEQEAKTFITNNLTSNIKVNSKKVSVQNEQFTKSSFSSSKNDMMSSKISQIINIDSDDEDLNIDQINKVMNDVEKKLSKPNNTIRKTILLKELPNANLNLKRPFEEDSIRNSKRRKIYSNSKTSHEFSMDDDEYVEVYTDGSCTNNGTKLAKAGLGVYFSEDHPLNVSEPVSGRATNNCGEIQAATKAIHIAHSMGIQKLAIKTDSKFVINSVTKWMSGWKNKGWKLATGEPVKNKIDFIELDKALKLLHVKWIYVEAHKGIFGNEKADQLAKEGASRYKCSRPTSSVDIGTIL